MYDQLQALGDVKRSRVFCSDQSKYQALKRVFKSSKQVLGAQKSLQGINPTTERSKPFPNDQSNYQALKTPSKIP